MQFAVVPLVSILPTASKGETSAEKLENQGELVIVIATSQVIPFLFALGSCSGAESTKQPVPDEGITSLLRHYYYCIIITSSPRHFYCSYA